MRKRGEGEGEEWQVKEKLKYIWKGKEVKESSYWGR